MLENEELLSKIKILEPQNELKLISFLITEFKKLNNLSDIFLKLGKSFVDISSEKESVTQWEGLRNYDSASMVAFNTKHSIYGELEFIFKNNKLVQSGILIFYENEHNKFLCELFDVIKRIIELNFYVIEQSQNIVSFSDNEINGYLNLINNSLSFRMADLKYCETEYGPSTQIKI
jgi:hypothetical protein